VDYSEPTIRSLRIFETPPHMRIHVCETFAPPVKRSKRHQMTPSVPPDHRLAPIEPQRMTGTLPNRHAYNCTCTGTHP
jgi:hypothetical protein